MGFFTLAFMTQAEFDTGDYCGREVFSRTDGEILVVADMIVPGGKNDVLWACRQLSRIGQERYKGHGKVLAHRGPRTGVFPNKGG